MKIIKANVIIKLANKTMLILSQYLVLSTFLIIVQLKLRIQVRISTILENIIVYMCHCVFSML